MRPGLRLRRKACGAIEGDSIVKIFILLGIAIAGAVAMATPVFHGHGGPSTLTGDYVEIRSCDVYTGPCFANGEMGLTGREAILTWSIGQGAWRGVPLAGLKVLAVVEAQRTLGDVQQDPPLARAVLVVDSAADAVQAQAPAEFARHMAGPLLDGIVRVESAPIAVTVHPSSCPNKGCATVCAEGLVEIQTRCLGGQDHVCGNEECFYPPLTKINDARPAYTVAGLFRGRGLGVTFDDAGRRSVYLGTFNE